MSADPIIYCLEHLTDYNQFERLCTDIMSQSGYTEIEPLGGSSDGGRDALHLSRTENSVVTIFAYSVRSDWKTKLLKEDCVRIRDEGHFPDQIVFATTATVSASSRDAMVSEVRDYFGWKLELFSIERLRTILSGTLRHLVAQHPAIFCPPFFPTRGGLSVAESHDTIVIDHVEADHATATWLSQRLQLSGFRTWCYGTAPIAGESKDDTIRELIANRAIRYIPILSPQSVTSADFVGRCSLAAGKNGLVIPAAVEEHDSSQLPSNITKLENIDFSHGLAAGLASTLDSLKSLHPPLSKDHGHAIAMRAFLPKPVTRASPEPIYASVFAVSVPDTIHTILLKRELTKEEKARFRESWAFSEATPTTLLSFQSPPTALPVRGSKYTPGYLWESCPFEYGKKSVNVVKELIRRSLDVAMARAGLQWCDDRKIFYFPHLSGRPNNNVGYVHVDGRKTRVAMTGEKSLGYGPTASVFRYQLCPLFRPGIDEAGSWWVTLRIYIRVTDTSGVPHQGKGIARRRKKVAKPWWNKEWFSRVLGVMQALSEDSSDSINVGLGTEAVSISTTPMHWECPVSIDYLAVEKIGDFQEEMASVQYISEEEVGTEA